jgi:hypothetical protein
MSENFNEQYIRDKNGIPQPLVDHSTSSGDGLISVYFRNIEKNLINHIMSADVVVGAVAWLTSRKVLEALSIRRGVALVVNKEDFLRFDFNSSQESYNEWREEQRDLYECLPGLSNFFRTGELIDNLTASLNPIRCVGTFTKSNKSKPRMHNKFILFCKMVTVEHGYGRKRKVEYVYENNHWKQKTIEYNECDNYSLYGNGHYDPSFVIGFNYIKPYAVWTGSFNFSKTATQSFENALYILDRSIVQAYFSEWSQLTALSEPLDWESVSISPEWMIGDYAID